MSSKLIIESGSTKTKWVLLINDQEVNKIVTTGMNPTVMSRDALYEAIEQGYIELNYRDTIDNIYFYVAGLDSELSRKKLVQTFNDIFSTNDLHIESDMLGACHAMSGDEPGFVAILGTGSNCTYYDGKHMHKHIPSLGYMISDEGSGNQIGKRVLRAYFYGLMSPELKKKFEKEYPLNKEIVLKNLYEEPMPNQYMARFAPFAIDNMDDPSMRQEVYDELDHFVKMNLLTADNAKEYPIHFVGSIAKYSRPILEEVLEKYGLKLGNISDNPTKFLIDYYKNK